MSSSSEDPTEIDYDEIVAETEAAVLIRTSHRDVWLPRSQIIEHDEHRNVFVVPEWLALKKDLA